MTWAFVAGRNIKSSVSRAGAEGERFKMLLGGGAATLPFATAGATTAGTAHLASSSRHVTCGPGEALDFGAGWLEDFGLGGLDKKGT